DKEKRMVNTLFTTTKAQCVGRYVFEVPASFENTLTDRAQINEVSISSRRLYRPAFEQRIRLREEVLKNSHTVDPIDQPFLKQVYRVSENAVIFDRNKNESAAGFGRVLEGHLYVDGVAFIISSEIRDVSDPKYKQERVEYLNGGMTENKLNTKPQKLAELQDLMSRLSGRKDDEIPTQPGTCISQGFIRDGSGKPKEDITFVYPHNSVFSLSVSTNTYLGDPKSMLERSNEIQPYLTEVKARTLRKGKVQMEGFEVDEWLNVAPSEKSPGHPSAQLLFNAIANEKIVDFRHPIIDLTLSNHALPPPAYSDAELVEIWDRITRSFRLRNNAF
ncbi:T6SS immunity protein Tli4 family protein, partial [Erwinia tasmaniensis]|uniref:T6SS immunity protein Tli4 family protein n=1 Tax=Erwinia tasmaniensis TaxID=338565 RepID=UPI003A4E2DB8